MRILCRFRRSARLRYVGARDCPVAGRRGLFEVMLVGFFASGASSDMQTNSACAPKPPALTPKTSSPASNRVPPVPPASTAPANSLPAPGFLGRIRSREERTMNVDRLCEIRSLSG